MKIQIILEVDIDDKDNNDLLSRIENDIVDVVQLAFEDNLNVEGYIYDPESVWVTVKFKKTLT